MSVSVTQQPQDYVPVYNNQYFTALSTQVAQPNFFYTVIVTDVLSGDSKTYNIPQRPDTYCVFDAGPFAESFMDNFIPINQYGWKKCSGAIREYKVNIGETYGSTPVYYAGTDIYYIAWNGVLDYLEFPSYDQDDYIYNATGQSPKFLTNLLNDLTFEDRSNYLYTITNQVNDFTGIEIRTFTDAGVQIGSTTIANPAYALSDYDEKYLCIDVGHKGLTNIDVGETTGDYPILTSNVSYYDIYNIYNDGMDIITGFLKRIYIGCEHDFTVYTVHFLAKSGAFESLHFHKRSDREKRTDRTTYKKMPHTLESGEYGYSYSDAQEHILSTNTVERFKLNTDWLDEDHVELYQQLIDSPVIYLDRGSDISYAQLKCVTDSYKINKKFNEKLFQLNIDFDYSHSNHRQRS